MRRRFWAYCAHAFGHIAQALFGFLNPRAAVGDILQGWWPYFTSSPAGAFCADAFGLSSHAKIVRPLYFSKEKQQSMDQTPTHAFGHIVQALFGFLNLCIHAI